MRSATLFVGPSGCGLEPSLLAGIEVLPPAQRGSIDRLISGSKRAGTLVLCDGAFKSVPAVSHAELCRALDRGWQVWGVSSLGAIRAFELAGEGMRGHGYVYGQFSKHEDFTDDEMCLHHVPQAPYEPLTEALVNVRYALETQGDALGIHEPAQRAVLNTLSALWFGDRTFERVRRLPDGLDAALPDQDARPSRHAATAALGRLSLTLAARARARDRPTARRPTASTATSARRRASGAGG
jgi:hypothetical protein